MTTVRLFIAGRSSSGFDSTRRRCHGDGSVSPRVKAVKKVDGKQLGGGGVLFRLDFEFLNNYRTATVSIFQITHNFSKEVEKLQK